MQTHELKRVHVNKKSKIVGRGGKRGKTSGRGHKGQKARAGHSIRPEIRDVISKIPKRRGYGKNRARTVNSSIVKPAIVNLSDLEKAFADDDLVTPAVLVVKKVINKKAGKLPQVKILSSGSFTKKIKVSGCLLSASAEEKIKKLGGKIKE